MCQLFPTSVGSAELDWRGGAGDDNVDDDDAPTVPHRPGICWAGPRRWNKRCCLKRLCVMSVGPTCCEHDMKRSVLRLRLAKTHLTRSSAMETSLSRTSIMLLMRWDSGGELSRLRFFGLCRTSWMKDYPHKKLPFFFGQLFMSVCVCTCVCACVCVCVCMHVCVWTFCLFPCKWTLQRPVLFQDLFKKMASFYTDSPFSLENYFEGKQYTCRTVQFNCWQGKCALE